MSQFRNFFSLFRVFFPSWKFFDEAGALPELFYRMQSGDWQRALPMPPFRLGNFFLNAQGNLHHACQNLVNRLLMDAAEYEADVIENSVSYRLVENLVRFQILQREPGAQGQEFQFKISVLNPEKADALISAVHEV